VIESIHRTKDEAISAAVIASMEQGPDGVVVVHEQPCQIAGDNEATCTCQPTTLQLGALA
jgi:hypothetical protein